MIIHGGVYFYFPQPVVFDKRLYIKTFGLTEVDLFAVYYL